MRNPFEYPTRLFEEDLKEISGQQPDIRRIFLTGGSPFALIFERLLSLSCPYSGSAHKMQPSVWDIKNKPLWQLKKLRALGVNGLTISAPKAARMKRCSWPARAYTAQDILEHCQKLEEAGIEYHLLYMTGIADKRAEDRNAEKSAALFKPPSLFISVDSPTLFPDTGSL